MSIDAILWFILVARSLFLKLSKFKASGFLNNLYCTVFSPSYSVDLYFNSIEAFDCKSFNFKIIIVIVLFYYLRRKRKYTIVIEVSYSHQFVYSLC